MRKWLFSWLSLKVTAVLREMLLARAFGFALAYSLSVMVYCPTMGSNEGVSLS
jgi:hypothetical protein